jgi:general secretion pathway protein K
LWLSAALAAIAFGLSTTVRGETERTATAVDDLRSYYLASSGVERAAMELLWSGGSYGSLDLIPRGATHIDYEFPSGIAHVEIIPESAKLNVNKIPVDKLFILLTALGVDPDRASNIAGGIADWRGNGSGGSRFDSYYLSMTPSFQPPHASFEEIEELLLVRGVTPDIFYGTWAPAASGGFAASTLVRHAGLNDCLTVYGSGGNLDMSAAEPAVLAASGVTPDVIAALEQQRQQSPSDAHMADFGAGASWGGLQMAARAIVTFRSTGRLRLPNGQLSDLRRTVGAQVKYLLPGSAGADQSPYHILRWYDTAWSN